MRRILSLALGATIVLCAALAATAMPAYNADEALLALYYTSAVKCHPGYTVTNWTCPACVLAGPMSDVTFVYDDKLQARGMTGYDPVRDRIVLSFRGTETLTNWIEDLDYHLVNYTTHPQCGPDCKVHKGFYETYEFMAQTLMPATKTLLAAHPQSSFMVTGHSLGAAQSQLALMDVMMTDDAAGTGKRTVTMINFGCPRVANPAFSDWAIGVINAAPTTTAYRVVHADDPVPMIPFTSMGFQHIPREFVWYDRSIPAPGWTYCNTTGVQAENGQPCGASSILQANVSAHTHYLGRPTSCTLTLEEQLEL